MCPKGTDAPAIKFLITDRWTDSQTDRLTDKWTRAILNAHCRFMPGT